MAQYDEYLFHRINETDYRQIQSESENERMNRRLEIDRVQIELERARVEEIRRAEERRVEERRRTLEHMHRHIREEVDGFEVDGFEVGGYAFGDSNLFGTKTKKEIITERLAVKYCFFLNRMIAIASGKFGYSESLSKKLHKANDWFSEDSVRNKLYKAIINEGSKNGIKQEKIDREIRRINSELGGKAISELLIGQFIGAVAIKIFKNNPNIIKDTGKVKKTSPQPQTEDAIGLNTIEAIREILRHIQEGEKYNRVQEPGIIHRPYNDNNDWLRTWQQIGISPIIQQYYDYSNAIEEDESTETKTWPLTRYIKDIFKV